MSRLFLSPKPLQWGQIDNKQFKDMTGIEVKKRQTYRKKATKPAVVYAGTQAPTENAAGYVTVPVVIAGFAIYYEVDEDLAADMAEKGISLQDKSGSVKSENEIYLEMYGYNPGKHNYTETHDAILADQEASTAKYRAVAFWTVSTTARYGSLATAYAPFGDQGHRHR